MASKFANIRTNDEELRIVMVGKTGVGKSATGNTILGRECFQSELSATSLTENCSKGKAEVDGQKVSVIDTPGLFDTRFDSQKTVKDISQCISFAAPGPHVFLVVIRLGRFTEEEKQTVQRIQERFGKAADKYSMVLFTGGDNLRRKTIEDFMKGSADLQELVSRCNDKYHVLNNNNLEDRSQVSELIKKIKDMVQKNGGSHYTNEMFQEAERAVEEEKQRILKETEEKICKEKEKLEREAQERYEKQIEKMNEEMQAERERERKEREEERRREREEMEEERKREKEEMEEERKREKEEMEEERKREAREVEREREREKENEIEMQRLKEEHERKLNEEKEKLKSKQEEEARTKAEESNPLYHLIKAFEHFVKAITSWFQSED